MLNQLRQQFSSFWSKQSGAQRMVLVVLVVVGVVLVPVFLAWASTPTYAVAFSGLEEGDAGAIVEKLNEESIPYQLRNSGTIMVPSDQVYDVRLMMARDGLPQGGTVGFEVFSGNTLGMTEFTQRVNYQQAMEGELERTIGSLNAVAGVRVHIVTPERTLLADDQQPATASVTIKERPGTNLDVSQVRSITHLVASSVEGMRPENVVVVDINGNMLASGEAEGDAASMAQSDSQRAAESLAAREIQNKVQGLLDSALGPNRSVVQAQVAMDWTERETTTQSFEPTTTAVRSSTDIMETYTTTNGTLSGVPGAVSNLPPADQGTGENAEGVSYKRTENITNYEVTQVQSVEIEAPGKIDHISLSVLVDGITNTQQLATLESVVAAAAGIDVDRGDVLAVQTVDFDRSYFESQAAEIDDGAKSDLYFQIAQIVGVVILALIALWYVQRLLNNLRLTSSQAWTPVLKPVSEMALSSGSGMRLDQMPSELPRKLAQPRYQAETQEERQELIKEPPNTEKLMERLEVKKSDEEENQLVYLVQGLADEDPTLLANVIQLWLREDDRNNG